MINDISGEMVELGRTAAAKALSEGKSPTDTAFIRNILEAAIFPKPERENLTPGVHRSIWAALNEQSDQKS